VIKGNSSSSPHTFFALVGLITGLLLCILTPPLKAPDEISHYARAYEISQGVIVSPKEGAFGGSIIPDSIIALHTKYGYPAACDVNNKASPQEIMAHLGDPLNPAQVSFFKNNATFYFPTVYLPASLVILIGRGLGASPLVMMYLVRLATMLVAVAITALAIRIAPIYKWLFVFLSLGTAAATQRASLSADSLTNAFALLLLAMALRLAFDPRHKLKARALPALLAVSVFVALAKQAYLVLPFALLIASPVFPKNRSFWMAFGLIAGTGLIAALGWNKATAHLNDYWDILTDAYPGEQIVWMMTHPFNMVAVLLRTVVPGLPAWLAQLFGNFGFCKEGSIYPVFNGLAFITFLFLMFADTHAKINPTRWQRLVLLCVSLLCSLLVLIANYLINVKGNYTIEGIVGRYFVPVLPFFCAAGYNQLWKNKPSPTRAAQIAMLASAALVLAQLAAVMMRYW